MSGSAVYRFTDTAILSVAVADAPTVVTSADIDAQLEETYARVGLRGGMLEAIAGISEGRYKTFMFLCWHAMKRQGQTEQTFEEFLADSPTFTAPEKVEDVPPLESAAPTGE